MIGRTHGVHAEPMTFGLKLALWYAEVERDIERVRRARDGRQRRQAVGRGRHVRASAAVDRSRRLPAPRPRAGAGRVAGDSARSPRRAAVGARHHRRVAREVRARDPRPAEDGDRRGRGAVRARARRARRRCRTSATRSAASRSSAWRGCFAATAHAAFENIALWHERDISHSSVERVILPDSFIALDHMLRRFTRIVRGHGRVSRADAREPRSARAASCSPGTVLLELAQTRRLARAGVRVGAAQRHALVRRAARLQGAAARRSRTSRACCRRPRSSGRSISTSSCKHVDDIFDRVFQPSREGARPHARARVRHAEAVGVRPAGQDHRRRAALARLRRRRGRPAGQVLRARSGDDRGRRRRRRSRPRSPTSCSRTR